MRAIKREIKLCTSAAHWTRQGTRQEMPINKYLCIYLHTLEIMQTNTFIFCRFQIQITSSNKTKDGSCHSPHLQEAQRHRDDPSSSSNSRALIRSRLCSWTTTTIRIMDPYQLPLMTSHSSNFPSRWVSILIEFNLLPTSRKNRIRRPSKLATTYGLIKCW